MSWSQPQRQALFAANVVVRIMTDKTHSDPELTKTRRMSFAGLTGAEVRDIADILGGLEHVDALPGKDGCSVVVTYCIADHKLVELECVLTTQGYRLESNLLERIRLGLIHFAEEIEQDNLHMPSHAQTRNDRLHAIYANAHERHQKESSPPPPKEPTNNF